MDHERIARENHRNRMNCAVSVYTAFAGENPYPTAPPKPRGDGGKCGAVLAAGQLLGEMGLGTREEAEAEFMKLYGSIKCADLRGILRGKCNDYVGAAARIVEKRM